MNKFIGKIGLLLLTVGFISVGLSSCKKKQPTTATITVVDTGGVEFPEAMVRLWPEPTIDEHGAIVIDDTMFTNGVGEATFDYTDDFNLGQAGFAVLNIEVRAEDAVSGEVKTGIGIIKIEPEQKNSETVVIQ